MFTQTVPKDLTTGSPTSLSTYEWAKIGLATGFLAVILVLIVQAVALVIWPETAAFKPLDSYARTAVFTLIPAFIATGLFAYLNKRGKRSVAAFVKIALIVLLLSIIPDYILPDPNRTLLASTITAFLHVVAGVITTLGIVLGYKRVVKSKMV